MISEHHHQIPTLIEINQQRNNVIQNYYSQFKEYEDQHPEKWQLVQTKYMKNQEEVDDDGEVAVFNFSYGELNDFQYLLPTELLLQALNFTLDIHYMFAINTVNINNRVIHFLNSHYLIKDNHKIKETSIESLLDRYKLFNIQQSDLEDEFEHTERMSGQVIRAVHISIDFPQNINKVDLDNTIKRLWTRANQVDLLRIGSSYFGQEFVRFLWENITRPSIPQPYIPFINEIKTYYFSTFQSDLNAVSILKSPCTTLTKSTNDDEDHAEYFESGFGRAILLITCHNIQKYRNSHEDHQEFYRIHFVDTILTGPIKSLVESYNQ
jgi:hypothetical protein